uniref:MOB kinase activator 2 n=1 Tax=Anser brachyrhynchus TaxID=132585 RepID=A0A8B9BLE9_9AVES
MSLLLFPGGDAVGGGLGPLYTSRPSMGCGQFPLGFLLIGSNGSFSLFLADDSEKQERDPLISKRHSHQTGACILLQQRTNLLSLDFFLRFLSASMRLKRNGSYTLNGKSKGKPNGKKPAPEEKKLYLEPEYTKSRITDFEFKELVMLPREIDLNEWLASNTTTFFHHINLQYSTISEFCTGESCQTMAVCNTQYYWYDERGKKIKCTAPQYVDFVMSSVQKLVTDEDVFPTKYGKEFPNSFESLVKKICKYLFHVLAHIYSSHFKETLALELHGHLNTLYTHFILFIREFNLVDPKETTIMDDLTEVLCSSSGSSSNGSGNGSNNSAGAQNHVKER